MRAYSSAERLDMSMLPFCSSSRARFEKVWVPDALEGTVGLRESATECMMKYVYAIADVIVQ